MHCIVSKCIHTGGPYGPYAGGYNGGYPQQQHQYYSPQAYGAGYEPYPAYGYYQPQDGMVPPGQGGPVAPAPYGIQRSASTGGGGPPSGHTSPAPPVMAGGMEYPQQEYHPMVPTPANTMGPSGPFHMEVRACLRVGMRVCFFCCFCCWPVVVVDRTGLSVTHSCLSHLFRTYYTTAHHRQGGSGYTGRP